MLVLTDALVGTVGGGRFEHEVIERARAAREPALVELALAAQLGMCCGGVMEVLISPITPDDEWLDRVVGATDSAPWDSAPWIATSLEPDDLGRRALESDAPALTGDRRFEHADVLETPDGRMLYERIESAPRMVLFGAGHVAAPTARIGHLLGYAVHVVDSRAEWNSTERFPDAQRQVLAYEDALFDYRPRPTDVLLIITHGHEFDQQILEAVIHHDVAYLGMIGSTSKVHKSLKRLQALEIDPAAIQRIHAPVGLTIGALTPEEIAVSITAEIIQARRAEGT
jgi:xanthine dehydrogenase accessory factor